MTDQPDDQKSEKRQEPAAKKITTPAKKTDKQTREEKLAEALRANLRRRKQAARDRKD